MSISRDDLWVTDWIAGGERDGTHDLRRATDADLAALGYARITEDCETCRGTAVAPYCDHIEGCVGSCEDCGGTGKKLRDGAHWGELALTHTRDGLAEWASYVSFPVEWLENESEGESWNQPK